MFTEYVLGMSSQPQTWPPLYRIMCDDPPTLSAEFFLFALVFLNRKSVGGAGRVVREMGHSWARVCPRINAPLPHSEPSG